jgi:AmiR/NasT family two-component response regulator
MRVWLIDGEAGAEPAALETTLRQLLPRWLGGLKLVAAGPFHADRLGEMRSQPPDIVIIRDTAWPEDPWLEEILALDAAVIVATSVEHASRFQALAEQRPVCFVSPRCSADDLWLALLSALAGQRRQTCWRNELARLNQRLSDRIVIERAKGILVQRLTVSEDQAYERLRILARRQRRPVRDIAQSVIDTQLLLSSESDGLGAPTVVEDSPSAEPRRPET